MSDLLCPKCGFKREPNTTECPQCGIIFEKYEMVQHRKTAAQKAETIKKQARKKLFSMDWDNIGPKELIVFILICVVFGGGYNIINTAVLKNQAEKKQQQIQAAIEQQKADFTKDIKGNYEQLKSYHDHYITTGSHDSLVRFNNLYDQFKKNDHANFTGVNELHRSVSIKDLEQQSKKVNDGNPAQYSKIFYQLAKLAPENQSYQERAKYYDRQIRYIGNKPKIVEFTGAVPCVETYLSFTLNDPDSLHIDTWGKMIAGDAGWLVWCKYRAKNVLGGYVTKAELFTIRHDKVVGVENFLKHGE